MLDNYGKTQKSRDRADEIFGDIYSDEEGDIREYPHPGDCPYPEEFDGPRGIDDQDEYGGDLFDPDCLKALAEAPPDDRARILERCDLFEPDLVDPVIGESRPSGPFSEADGEVVIRWDFDICAWYQPIHYYRRAFGIYIRRRCLARSAREIFRQIDPAECSMPRHILAGYCLLGAGFGYLLHEFYHHKVEAFGTRLEIAQRPHARRMFYLEYKSGVYRPLLHSGDPRLLEEALANAYAYRQMGQVPYRKILPEAVFRVTRSSLKNSFAHQPGGYGEAENYLSNPDFALGEYKLQQQILECSPIPSPAFEKWRNAPDMLRSLFQVKDVPTYILR